MTKRKLTEKQFDDKLEKLASQPTTKKKGTKEMKTRFYKTTTFTVITTIVVTLGAVAGAFYLYDFVYNKGVNDERNRQANVKVEAAQLVAELKSQSK